VEVKEMSMQKSTARPMAIGLIVLGALIRVTQALNFAPVGAISLFAGARLRGWQAYAVPLALMAITDAILGGNSAWPAVYLAFLITVWIGTRVRHTENPWAIGAASLAGSIQFFLITNFGSWLAMGHAYPRTLQGLFQCYAAGVPFYWRTLASDVLYTAILFGLHAWLSRTVARREQVTLQAA
jgi:hypothetical protein